MLLACYWRPTVVARGAFTLFDAMVIVGEWPADFEVCFEVCARVGPCEPPPVCLRAVAHSLGERISHNRAQKDTRVAVSYIESTNLL